MAHCLYYGSYVSVETDSVRRIKKRDSFKYLMRRVGPEQKLLVYDTDSVFTDEEREHIVAWKSTEKTKEIVCKGEKVLRLYRRIFLLTKMYFLSLVFMSIARLIFPAKN